MSDNGKPRSIDPATIAMLQKAGEDGVSTAFQRSDDLRPCPIGADGACCKICAMGPCRVPVRKGQEDDEARMGVCGANASTIAARNFIRMIAAGSAAHSDHGRDVAETLLHAARGEMPGYEVKDEKKLFQLALELGIEVGDRPASEIAEEVANIALQEFGKHSGHLLFTARAPKERQDIWDSMGVRPRNVDTEIVQVMHRTHMGVDSDYHSLMQQGTRAALADGWGGSMIATDLQDILFGTPYPILGEVNLGVLDPDKVNVIVHGHEPILSEIIVHMSRDPELLERAERVGAKGINVAGICCTANEVLMRNGVPVAGNFLQQELAMVTGAVEAMVVDVQCVMPSLPNVAGCYHTKVITTSDKARISGAEHIPLDQSSALDSARSILEKAIDNFPNRPGKVTIPDEKMDMVAGFSHETINYLLGGLFRASYAPLNENIINGRIRGVAGVVGCNNPRVQHDSAHVALVKELIKNDVLVLQTGCAAIASGKAGLLVPEAARFAGDGLGEICDTVGIPPVLHMGACVDNSRILVAASEMVRQGGLGTDISALPVAGAAMEWMSEKAIAIGQYFVASGVFTVFGATFPTLGSKNLTNLLFEEYKDSLGGAWAFEPDPEKAAKLMIDHIDSKRKALGIDKARERILFDMDMRRTMASN